MNILSKEYEKTPGIPHISHSIDGFCNFRNFYTEIANWIPNGGIFVEVGAYWGQSFSWAVVECLNLGKKVDLVAVDAWPDAWTSPEGWPMFNKFVHEMQPLTGHYRTIRGGSSDSAQYFQDGTVDFVFIDADHIYERVRDDINAWLPKIKPGGIIAGHDYNPPHEVERAVNEIFGNRVVRIPSDDNDGTEATPNFYSWKVQL
jgi:hypothetical protein